MGDGCSLGLPGCHVESSYPKRKVHNWGVKRKEVEKMAGFLDLCGLKPNRFTGGGHPSTCVVDVEPGAEEAFGRGTNCALDQFAGVRVEV